MADHLHVVSLLELGRVRREEKPMTDDDDRYIGPGDDDEFIDPGRGEFGFADPGGRSALRAATTHKCPHRGCGKRIGARDSFCRHCGRPLNPRKFPCPTCGAKDVLTAQDVSLSYCCNNCADRAEGRYVGGDY